MNTAELLMVQYGAVAGKSLPAIDRQQAAGRAVKRTVLGELLMKQYGSKPASCARPVARPLRAGVMSEIKKRWYLLLAPGRS